jgi:hypothetical protein
MNQQLKDGFIGALWGVLIGGLGGLGVCIWLIDDPPFFPGDTIAIGACICGFLGFFIGEPFLEWMKENWHWFS